MKFLLMVLRITPRTKEELFRIIFMTRKKVQDYIRVENQMVIGKEVKLVGIGKVMVIQTVC